MPSRRPRLYTPLAVSLLLHAALAAVWWMLPWRPAAPPERGPAAGRPGLSVAVRWADRPLRRAHLPRDEEYVDIGVAQIRHPAASLPPAPSPAVHPSATPQGTPSAVASAQGSPAGGASPGPGGTSGEPSHGGRKGQVNLRVPEGARRVVYLIDRSISMGPTGALDRAREEVSASLRSLPAGTLVQIVSYNRAALPLLPAPEGLAALTPELCRHAEQRLEGLAASGDTDHVNALRRALYLRPDVLFLLTDAADLKPADVLGITALNRGRTAIHVVELTSTRGGGPSSARLAERNAGRHRLLPPRR